MRRFQLFAIALSSYLASTDAHAQLALPAQEAQSMFRDAQELWDKGLHIAASQRFSEFLRQQHEVTPQYFRTLGAYHTQYPAVEPLIREYLATYPDATHGNRLRYHLGMWYFEKGLYKPAADELQIALSRSGLTTEEQTHAHFMLGYAYFTQEEYESAEEYFKKVLSYPDSPDKNDAQYYYALLRYKRGDYTLAYEALKPLHKQDAYKEDILVYEANCLLKLHRYDELAALLAETPPAMLERNNELFFLSANAQFEAKNYKQAAAYFQRFADGGGNFSRSDKYRYGFACYKSDDNKRATPLFLKVADATQDTLTQAASYYLGSSFAKEKDQNNARTAFKKAADIAAVPQIQQDARYLYAKLCYATERYDDALVAFKLIEKSYPTAAYIEEVRTYIGELLQYARNYSEAMTYLETASLTSKRAREAYQAVAYERALELFKEKKYTDAEVTFRKVIANDLNRDKTLSAYYWIAEGKFQQKQYAVANDGYTLFMRQAGAQKHAQYGMAQYGTGWCYFKEKKYSSAYNAFVECVKMKDDAIDSRYRNDACLRAGDCKFLSREYPAADELYSKSLAINVGQQDYATYQLSESAYRQGQYGASVAGFASMIQEYPQSELRNNALDRISEIYYTWLKDNAKAIFFGRLLVADYPRSPLAADALNRVGIATAENGDNAAAIADFKRVLTDFPADQKNCQIALESLSQLLTEEEYNTLATAYRVENPALNTQLARVDFEKGRQKFVSGENKGAIDALSAYLSAYPNGEDVREASIYRARAYANGGKSSAALKDYEAVYSQNTVDRWTMTALSEAAEILQGNKNYLGALKLYQNIDKIAEKSATKADARFGMAACYRALQQYKQVEIALAPVTEDKNLPESVRNRAKTESGVAAYRQNRIDLALQLFTEVEDEGDGEPAAESQYWRVRIFADQKRYKEAKAGAVYLANNYPTFNYWKAKAYLVMAEADVALEEKFQAKATLESLAGESRYPDVQQEAKEKLAALNL